MIEGDPKFESSQNLPNVPYHRFAELIGLNGLYIDDPVAVAAAWREALAADRPTLIEFKTDPSVPPLPPHFTLEQAKHFASALWTGDPEQSNVIKDTAKQVLSSLVPA